MEFAFGLVTQAGWFSVILLLCFTTAWGALGIRQAFSWQAALALLLFYAGVAASNAWQFVPILDGEAAADPEAQRLWFLWATEVTYQAKLMVRNLAIGMALILAMRFKNHAPTLTWAILWVWFAAEMGESLERYVCKSNDPSFGFEHIWRAAGDIRPSCEKAFGGWGPTIFPLVTVTPMPIIFGWSWWKMRRTALSA